ncbi:MAG: CaiB/BaiF CoA-transferase family protein [Acidimicrobiia bacterium]|nr:CaiB/BaiF CoA-transferase family protein [Acidimicrobiia bacterium]
MGPLAGVRVVELAGIGPGPFTGMLLADLGADVVQIERTAQASTWIPGFMARGRRSMAVDLKHPDGLDVVLRLVDRADILIEGFRPGVAERLGVGPDECFRRNQALVYGRMTGWGQDGPLAKTAGHDIDYLAMSGALWPIGPDDRPPPPPLNLIGDFGGGAMFLAVGVLAALHEARTSGVGQIVDAAMVDGSALLTTMFHEMRAAGLWDDVRGGNLLDGGAPFYDTYQTGDGRYVAVGALEPQFYAALLEGLGLAEADLPAQMDRSGWPELRERFSSAFATKSRDEWEEVFRGTDACVSPVLTWSEASSHPHNVARATFVEVAGTMMPAPAPRFSRTPAGEPAAQPPPGANTDEVLTGLGYAPDRIAGLRAGGAVA